MRASFFETKKQKKKLCVHDRVAFFNCGQIYNIQQMDGYDLSAQNGFVPL